jgi:hypothetical protein
MMRRPVPYIRRQTSPLVPSSRASSATTSARVNTTGKRRGALADSTSSSQGSST